MTCIPATASLWMLAVRYPEVEREYLAVIILITVGYCVLNGRMGLWFDRLAPVSTLELRRLSRLQSHFGLGMFIAALTLPAILIALGVLPFGANVPGLWVLIISNALSGLWFGRRRKLATQRLVADLTPGQLPAAMSERVGGLVLSGDFVRAMFDYRKENPGASAKQAREAIYGYLSARIESRDQPREGALAEIA